MIPFLDETTEASIGEIVMSDNRQGAYLYLLKKLKGTRLKT